MEETSKIINSIIYPETVTEMRECAKLYEKGLHLKQRSSASLGGNLYAVQDKGLVRENQEDSVLLSKHPYIENFSMMVVADGMGGEENGEKASKIAIDEMNKWFTSLDYNDMSDGDVKSIKKIMSKEIKGISKKIEDECLEGGTTLVCAIIKDGKALIANVGDSRAYMIKGKKIEQITKDHSPSQENYEKVFKQSGYMWDDMRFFKKNNLVSQCLGRGEVKPSFYLVYPSRYDKLILCSDGIHDILKLEEIGYIASSGKSEQEIADKLIDAALTDEPIENLFKKNGSKKSGSRESLKARIELKDNPLNPLFKEKIDPGKDNASVAIYSKDKEQNER